MTRGRYSTNVGRSLGSLLAEKGQTQGDLANSLSVTASYVSQVASGKKAASAEWLDTVAKALDLTPEERVKLHRAGAKDAGFKLDLSEPE